MTLQDHSRAAARPSAPAGCIDEDVAVIGLGYVGLPVAVALSGAARKVVGHDASDARVAALRRGVDPNGEVSAIELAAAGLTVSADAAALAGASVYIITVPTPIDRLQRPDLGAVIAACEAIGAHLSPGAIVVLESTVYPGVTEEVCGPVLERVSGLRSGIDFFLAYSPERINPGDPVHRFDTITKVVSAQTPAALDRVAALYGAVVKAGIHRAPSIRVAEAAKVIENTQRDINIALMNELSVLFERIDIPMPDVLAAAGTKWNFLPFRPGLVGGHCIGVDPYYLAAKAQEVGLHPEIILAGRRINDAMGPFVAQRCLRMLAKAGRPVSRARVGILGATFKENVPDMRNSRVPDIAAALAAFGIAPLIHDPALEPAGTADVGGAEIASLDRFGDLDALILAVPHEAYLEDVFAIAKMLAPSGCFLDLKDAVPGMAVLRPDVERWAL